MRQVQVEEITNMVERLCRQANYVLTDDVRSAFTRARDRSARPWDRRFFSR